MPNYKPRVGCAGENDRESPLEDDLSPIISLTPLKLVIDLHERAAAEDFM